MKKLLPFLILAYCSCKNEKPAPDVSNVPINLQLQRFDEDLFSIDTSNVQEALNNLQQQYGSFLNDYLYNIMVLPPQPDSVTQKIKLFLHDYNFVYNTAQKQFKSFDAEFTEIRKGLQFV